MTIKGVIEVGLKHCECENSTCGHGEKPCHFWAEETVKIDGAGTFNLCPACSAHYSFLGY